MTSVIPSTISFSSVLVGERGRTQLFGIADLASSIQDGGLIQPIVLAEIPGLAVVEEASPAPLYQLIAGGRRYAALRLLVDSGDLPPILHHATTSDPAKPGFILTHEAGTVLTRLLLEIKENLDRSDMDWRDEVTMIVKAYRLAKADANTVGEALIMRDFGSMLGCGEADLKIANKIYDHFIANPKMYEDVTSINGTLAVLLKCQANEVARVIVTRSAVAPTVPSRGIEAPQAVISVPVDSHPRPESDSLLAGESALMEKTVEILPPIPLSSSFFNLDAYAFMESSPPGFCDHIICDPDYALEGSVLNSHPNNRPGVMLDGIAQESASDSLDQLCSRLMPLAFRSIAEHGFFVFWYAIDYQEQLKAAAIAAGFRVQGWPCIWNKSDFRGRSNTAPNHNFPKSVEFAMICRKPGTVLAKIQTSCVYTTSGDRITKELGHPFAKPFDIWRWLFAATTAKGQIVYDPFVGTGSSAIAAIRWGLRPIGTEINSNLYANLLVNLQTEYRKLLGPQVRFS